MRFSIFLVLIYMIVSSCTSYAAPQEKQDLSYTGIPELYVELNEIHLVDINGVRYSAYADQSVSLSKVTIAKNGALIEVAGQCFQGINFPDLQTLKVSKSVPKEGSRGEMTIFNMEFHYFGDKNTALHESTELQDWSFKLQIASDLSSVVEVKGEGRKVLIECEVTNRGHIWSPRG